MKKILSFLTLTLCLFLFSQEAKATHAAGGELIYELVPNTTNTYKFTFKFYRDCSGSAEPASFSLCYNNGCGLANQTVTMPKVVGLLPNGLPNGSPVSSGCPGFPTNCVGGQRPDIANGGTPLMLLCLHNVIFISFGWYFVAETME